MKKTDMFRLLYICISLVHVTTCMPLTSWVTSDPAPGQQAPGPPPPVDTTLCSSQELSSQNYDLNITISHSVFDTETLVAGISYLVTVTFETEEAEWLAVTSDVTGARFKVTPNVWSLCESQGLLVNVRNVHSFSWSYRDVSQSPNATFRAELYSRDGQVLTRTYSILPLLSECSLTLQGSNVSYTWLQETSHIFTNCYLSISRPEQGLIIELTRLNIAGSPNNCAEGGYIKFATHTLLCGKLEEQSRREYYWPRLEDENLSEQNSTFTTTVTRNLICSMKIHIAFGYRVAFELEIRRDEVINEVQQQISDDNQVDEAPSMLYTKDDDCIGVLVKVSGDLGEFWSQCATGPGHVIRALSQSNRLQISIASKLELGVLHMRYFALAQSELTEACPGYGWVSVSETVCVLPVSERAVTWAQADKECAKRNAHLASVSSEQMQNAIDEVVRKSPGYNDEAAYWLGATDRIREGDFRWIDDQPLTYTNWFPGWSAHAYYNRQPSDDGFSSQDCLEMRRTFLSPSSPGLVDSPRAKIASKLMWNDRDCSANNFYLCQVSKHEEYGGHEVENTGQCGRNVTLGRELGRSTSAVVTSPGFPQPYPDNARCLTRVTVPRGYHVVIEFEELVLEKEPMCSYDYLEISEPDSDEVRRLCHDWSGKLKLLRHVSRSSELYLLFSSDYSHRFGGFKARVFMESDELQCADNREVSFNGSCFLLVGFPEVTWTTARQVCRGMGSELASVHSAEEQRFLVASIRNSEQYSASVIYWLGGQVTSGTVEWNDRSAVSYYGWAMRAPRAVPEQRCLALGWLASPSSALPSGIYWQSQRCTLIGGYVCRRRVQASMGSLHENQTLEGSYGTVTSPDYPQTYPANVDYWVRIIGPADSRLVLNFSRMDLEVQTDCLYDFVALWDEGAAEPALVLCSGDTPQFVSLTNVVYLHFHTDYSVSGTGFSLTWRAVPLFGCPEQTLTAVEGVLISPNHPHFLLSGLDCTTTILAPAGRRVWLQLEDCDLDSEWASLEIQMSEDTPPVLPLQVPGLISDGVFISTREALKVRLRTLPGRHLTGRGFRATYKTLTTVDETRVITLSEVDNSTTKVMLPLNWPALPVPSASIQGFTQRLVAPVGHMVSLTLRGVRVSSNLPALPESAPCLEIRDFYAEANGTSWLLCPEAHDAAPVTLVSFLNSLNIRQSGGALLNASVSVIPDAGLKQKLLTRDVDLRIESCDPNPCLHDGVCVTASTGRPAYCQCPDKSHYTGAFCAVTWCETNPCEFGTCSLQPEGGFTCSCRPGYRGIHCEVKYRPCSDNPCEGRGDCKDVGDNFSCRCHAWWEGIRCEKRMMRIPFKPLSERMLQEPFWLGLITVMFVLSVIGLVWCAKRHFPEKLEKLLADEADRSRHISYSLSTSASRDGGSPLGAPRSSILGRLGLRKPSLLSLAPASPKDGGSSAPRTFSLDDLLRRTPSPRKKRTNSTPTRKPIDKKQILQQLVSPAGNTSVAGTSNSRKVSLGELIQLSEKTRRANSEDGTSSGPLELETSLDLDPKLEKKVTFARLLDKVSAEMSSGSNSGSPPPSNMHHQGNSGSEDVTLSGSDPALPVTGRKLPSRSSNRLARMSSADSILAMFRTFSSKASPSTPSSPQDVSECDSSAVPTPASSSAPDSPLSLHHTTIEVPVVSSGGSGSSPSILLEIPNVEYGKCLSPIKEVPTPCPSPAPTPLLPPRRRASQERLEDDEALRIEVLHPAPGPTQLHIPAAPLVVPTITTPEDLSPTRIKARPPSSLQIPTICLPDEDLSPKGPGNIIIPTLIVQTPSPPPILNSPPPSKKLQRRFLMGDKPSSLEYPNPPPMITITAMSEAESDTEPNVAKVTSNPGMAYLSPFSMCARADHRTTSESNLSSSGYSSMASPGPSRCGSSNPLCSSEPEEVLTPGSAAPSPTPPIPPPRKPSPLTRTPAIQEAQVDSNDEGFGTDREEQSSKLQLPAIIVQDALSPVSSRSESPLSDKTTGLDRFSPLFYHKPELPFTDSDGLYDCPSSEVMQITTTPSRNKVGRKKERRRSNCAATKNSLGGLLEVPSLQQVHRSARKPSPKRRAARIAPPSSSSSSSDSLYSPRGSRSGTSKGQDSKARTSPGHSKSPSNEAGEVCAVEVKVLPLPQPEVAGNSSEHPPPSVISRNARKISRMKVIGHQIRFLRRLELSLRRREQNSQSDSLDTDLSSPTSSPTLPVAPNLLRLKARALTRRQLPARFTPRCELATFLLGAPTVNHQDSD